jgi:hypothetical protein
VDVAARSVSWEEVSVSAMADLFDATGYAERLTCRSAGAKPASPLAH